MKILGVSLGTKNGNNDTMCRVALEAARDAGVTLRLIEERRAAPDHPVAMSIPETDYLKFYLLQIV